MHDYTCLGTTYRKNNMKTISCIWILLCLVSLSFGKIYLNDYEDEQIELSHGDQTFNVRPTTKTDEDYNDNDDWGMRYFPKKPFPIRHKIFSDDDMFSINSTCDNGKTNLHLDWDNSIINYTCFEDYYNIHSGVRPILHNDLIPLFYKAAHMCMETTLEYSSVIPTFGNHRSVWARYGEYTFVPKQRWMHNLEHGAVVMLYHPCASPALVQQLRSLVTSCLERYIITPYNLLSKDRPLALVTWGWYLNMNSVDTDLVIQFIKEHAFHGPEDIAKDGNYDFLLLQEAEQFYGNNNYSELCSNFQRD